MEVHTHTHTPRKKWTHYFWEFLMLFLAVFCGFLAENQREHMVEHRREKQYIKSLSEDLKSDIKQIDNISLVFNARISLMDSIINDLSGSPSLNCLKQLYHAIGFPDFIYTDRTIQQLKNSGSLRLIRKSHVADSIIGYDIHVRSDLIHQENMNTTSVPNLYDKLNYIVDFSEWVKLYKNNYTDSNAVKDAILLVRDKNEIIRLKNNFLACKFDFVGQLKRLTAIKENANRLLEVLKQEYHIQ